MEKKLLLKIAKDQDCKHALGRHLAKLVDNYTKDNAPISEQLLT